MFIPIRLKSDFSLGYGTTSVDALVARAADLGYSACGLADRENLYGAVRFQQECRRRGIRPVTGVEFQTARGSLVLLAADRTGYGNLCRIVSRRHGINSTAAAPPADLVPLVSSCTEGLFLLSDDPEVIERLLIEHGIPRHRLGILLVRPTEPEADRARQAAARRLHIPLVADLDALFLHRDDRMLHALQLAIRSGRSLAVQLSHPETESEVRLLRGPADAAALFVDVPEALAATFDIAAACAFDIATVAPHAFPDGTDPAALRAACLRAGGERLREDAYRNRLDEELATFSALGFTPLLYAVSDILTHCRTERIPVVLRGSAVSSLTLHLLGGSLVDPLQHGLLFERFLHRGKTAWPDIDIDLPWHRRDEVIDWVYRRFGRNRVATVSALHLFKARSALREGLKACGARPALIERLARALPPEDLAPEDFDFLDLADAARETDPLLSGYGSHAGLPDMLRLVRRLVGRPRHVAAHPGGIIIAPQSLDDLLPLERAPKGIVITQFDAASVERLGLVKIDLLGNRCLSELDEALLSEKTGDPFRAGDIPLDDPKTLDLIDRADTIGCFQLESPTMRSLLTRIPIMSYSDVIAALALIRPGAAAGRMKAAFVARARGEEAAVSAFPALADRLRETHGLLLYEEDIMLLLATAGGMSLAEADEFRSALIRSGGDSEALRLLREEFLSRAPGPEAPPGELLRAWRTAVRFAAYSFNKAHAASYGLLAYLSAYAKAHYPERFAAALLNHHEGLYPLRTTAAALIRSGVRLVTPHVNQSVRATVVTADGAVRIGLDAMKGITTPLKNRLLRAREESGPFPTLIDLLGRTRPGLRELRGLVLSGACDGLHPLTSGGYPFVHEAALELIAADIDDPTRLERVMAAPAPDEDDRQVRLYRELVRVRNELAFLGMHITAHPMALLRHEAGRYGCRTICDATETSSGGTVRLAVTVAAMRRVATGAGPMQFVTLEDETGLLEAVVLPADYRALGERIGTPGPFLVEGLVRQRQGSVHLEIRWLSPFRERKMPFGKRRGNQA